MSPELICVGPTTAFGGATVTFVDALFPGPETFDGVTVMVVDCVTVTICEPTLVDAASPLTGGDAVQAKPVGAVPPAQDVVRVTLPPLKGKDDGDGVIVHPEGWVTTATLTVVDPVFPGPAGFEGVTVKVVVCVMFAVSEPPLVDVGRPLTGGDAVQVKAAGALPPEQEDVRATLPPPKGNDDGDALTVHPDGWVIVATLTTVDAGFPDPPAFEGVTVKIVVCVMFTFSERTSVDVGRPATGGDAVQAKVVGALPPKQEAIRVTSPPPKGNDDRDDATVHPDGGTIAGPTLTVVDAVFPCPAEFAGVSVNVVV